MPLPAVLLVALVVLVFLTGALIAFLALRRPGSLQCVEIDVPFVGLKATFRDSPIPPKPARPRGNAREGR